jgi:hypothetical protein
MQENNRVNKLEVNMAKIETKLSSIEKKLDEQINCQKEDINDIKLIIKSWMKEADSRYAAKLVEQLVYGLAALILLAFSTALVSIIMNGK